MVELANEIQRQKFHTYYSLQTDSNFVQIGNKIKQIARQAGLLIKHSSPPIDDQEPNDSDKQLFNLQFMDIYRMISTQPSFCECGKDPGEFGKFIKVMARPISTELAPIFELAPCVSYLILLLFLVSPEASFMSFIRSIRPSRKTFKVFMMKWFNKKLQLAFCSLPVM